MTAPDRDRSSTRSDRAIPRRDRRGRDRRTLWPAALRRTAALGVASGSSLAMALGATALGAMALGVAPLAARAQAGGPGVAVGPAGAAARGVVRGVVSDSASGRPLADATVAVVDAEGRAIAAAITAADGRYALTAPAGRYRLQLRRIGYRSIPPVSLVLVAGETVRHDLPVPAVAMQLATLRTDARARCLVYPERGSPAAMLWAEITKALDAASLMQRAGATRLTVRDDERELDPRTLTVRAERHVERTGISTSPYASPPPDTLAARGYVRDIAGQTWYYAPTADALVSETFAATHCVQVALKRPPAPTLIGLQFEPIEHRGVPDVRGIIWVDLVSAELRHLDFEYTDLPRWASGYDFGGRVDFGRLPDAGWIVRKWVIRAPRAGWIERSAIVAGAGGNVYGTRIATRREEGIVAIREVGGEVVHVDAASSRAGTTDSA